MGKTCVINTILDILFVKLGMGVFGAALATIMSALRKAITRDY